MKSPDVCLEQAPERSGGFTTDPFKSPFSHLRAPLLLSTTPVPTIRESDRFKSALGRTSERQSSH